MLLKTSWIFVFFHLSYSPTIGEQNSTINYENVDLSTVVLYLAREHISKFSTTIVIAEHSIMPETAVTNIFIMNFLLLQLHETISVQLYFSEKFDQPREYYIFIVDSIDAFRILRSGFADNKNNRHFYFLIVLTHVSQDFRQVMKGIYQLCLEMNVYDVNIIVEHPKHGVCMFILFLFGRNNCRVVMPHLYHKFGHPQRFDSLKQVKRLFPEKLTNFHGCPLRVSCRAITPFVNLKGNESDPKRVGNWDNFDGIESYLLKYLSTSLNFTLDVLPFPLERTYALQNGTAFGCFKDLITNKADIAVGGFSASDPSHGLFSTSDLVHSSPFVYIVNPQEKLSPLGRLAKPISRQAWNLLALLLLLGMFFLATMRFVGPSVRSFFYGPEISSPGFNFISVFLGYAITRTPRRTFARFILMMWMLLWFVIRNAYQGALYDAIRLDRYVQIPTGFEDLVRKNYQFMIPPEIDMIDIFPKNRSIVTDSVGYFDRYRVLEKSKKNYAAVTLQDNFLSYMSKAYFNGSSLYFINEIIFMYQVVMFFPKNSILLGTFNNKLSDLTISGLAKHLSNYYTTHPALFSKIFERPPTKPFSNERIVALYEIYFLLTLLALFVFCLELLSIRYKKLQKILKWIN